MKLSIANQRNSVSTVFLKSSILALTILSIAQSANAAVYKKDANGQKFFVSKWNPSQKTGEISFQIESPYRESSVAIGSYDLSKSQANGIMQGVANCDVKTEGIIEYTAQNVTSSSALKLKFTGAGCEKFVTSFAYKAVRFLPIWRIQTASGSEANLSIRITGTALNNCGDGGSLALKAADCLAKNKATAKRTVHGDVASKWSLVAFDEKKEVWRDDATKITWSGPPNLGQGATHAEAVANCSADLFLKFLPTPEMFEKAANHGLFLIYPMNGLYWTTEIFDASPTTKLATTYQPTPGQPADDMKGAFPGTSDVLKKWYFHCVGQ